jgi:hypothetical protein
MLGGNSTLFNKLLFGVKGFSAKYSIGCDRCWRNYLRWRISIWTRCGYSSTASCIETRQNKFPLTSEKHKGKFRPYAILNWFTPYLVSHQIAPSSAQLVYHLLFQKDDPCGLVHPLSFPDLLQMKFHQAPSLLVDRP